MEWKIGMIPSHVFKDHRISPQDLNTARRANALHARAEAQRKPAEQTPPSPSHLPSQLLPPPAPREQQPARAAKQKPARDVIRPPLSQQGELRLSLMRKLAPFLDHWRQCPARACRRHRMCASAALECTDIPDRKPRNPRQDAAALARLQRAIVANRQERQNERQQERQDEPLQPRVRKGP